MSPLRQLPGDEIVSYEYASDKDRRGKEKSRTAAKD